MLPADQARLRKVLPPALNSLGRLTNAAASLANALGWIVLGPVRIGPGALAGLCAVWGCTAVSWYGVREGVRFQDFMSVVKIAAIALLCAVGPLAGAGDWSRLAAGRGLMAQRVV